MRNRLIKGATVVLCLTAAALLSWTFFSDTQVLSPPEPSPALDLGHADPDKPLVTVGDDPIYSADVDFEVRLLTAALDTPQEPPIEQEGNARPGNSDEESEDLSPEERAKVDQTLRQEILATIVERKTLFTFLSQDQKFDKEQPSRFSECLAEWQQTLKESAAAFDRSQDKERLKKLLCEKSLINQYVAEQVYAKADASDEEVREYFRQHEQEFATPERVTIRQIHLNDEKTARQVRFKVRPGNFAAMAAENSLTPEAANGGLLGPFARGDYPGVFDYAFKMQQNEISDVLKSPYGFHIFFLVAKHEKKDADFQTAAPAIRSKLAAQKREEEYDLWVNLATKRIAIVPSAQSF